MEVEVIKAERSHYFGRWKETVLKPGQKFCSDPPSMSFPPSRRLCFRDIIVKEGGITVIERKARLDPRAVNPPRAELLRGDVLSEVDYPGEEINQRQKDLSPTTFDRDPLAAITGHRIVFKCRLYPYSCG